jgi:hypothetical protein
MRSSFGRIDDKMMNVPSDHDDGPADCAQVCSRCGAPFRCGTLAGDATCWCASLPALPPDSLRPGAGCLCPACLAAETERIARPK